MTHIHVHQAVGWAIVIVLVCVVIAGCGYDHELSITNNTNEAYYIRVPEGGPGNEGKYRVTHISPGASGWAMAWRGGRDVEIELLDLSCSLVGLFESDDGVTYRVPGVDGLEGRITRYLTSGEGSGPDIQPTNACGGTIYM